MAQQFLDPTSPAALVNLDRIRSDDEKKVFLDFLRRVERQYQQTARVLNENSTDVESRLTAMETDSGWIAPTLLNSWVNYGSGLANAGYRKIGNLVRLRGIVKDGTGAVAIFTLPSGYRPTVQVISAAVAFDGAVHVAGRVDVETDGDVILYNPAGGAGDWVSLDNVSFLVT